MSCFVKFVKYNEKTLASLNNKTIKFSTVFEFNDFNELQYISDFNVSSEEIKETLKETLLKNIKKNPQYKCYLINNADKSGKYCRKYLIEFAERLNQFSQDNDNVFICTDFPLITELLAYSSVGIFSVSNIRVFCDDSAQLMFAHYADNLKGLALIYETSNNTTFQFKEISYENMEERLIYGCCYFNLAKNNLNEYTICRNCKDRILKIHKEMSRYQIDACSRPCSGGLAGRITEWLEGKFEEVEDFLKKSKKWSYEWEYRLIDNPGVKEAKEAGVELKAILYTPRLKKENFKTLKKIKKQKYPNNLILQEIKPSDKKFEFLVDQVRSIDWLKKFKIKPD